MADRALMEKYKRFVLDHNNGMSKDDLCRKYQLETEKFDPFIQFLKRKGFVLASVPSTSFRSAHEIDFEIFGDDMQFVEIELDPNETAIAEAGAMMYMDGGIEMQTILGDGSKESESVMGKIFGAGKRVLTGESLFMTAYTNRGGGKQRVAFGAPYPGKIIALDLADLGGELLCQKTAFLCAAKGVSVEIAFQKKLGVGLFGGEGFILQRLRGDGFVFAHAGGTIIEKELKPMERMRVDTGCIAALQKGIDYNIEFVGGVKTALFGGEGIFFATVTGPGKVWLQSLPFSRLAERIIASAPQMGGQQRGQGSILGGLGDLLGGDNRF
jgi:uncharacterized protein (TIGR00266 family)